MNTEFVVSNHRILNLAINWKVIIKLSIKICSVSIFSIFLHIYVLFSKLKMMWKKMTKTFNMNINLFFLIINKVLFTLYLWLQLNLEVKINKKSLKLITFPNWDFLLKNNFHLKIIFSNLIFLILQEMILL